MRNKQTLALELLAKDDRIHTGLPLVTQPISKLLAGRLAIDGTTTGGVPPHTGQARATTEGPDEG